MESSGYGAPPPPPPPVAGNIPARRLQTQLPAEPPACVQNAMMTKDKKPFTYTPGGIDLSQIKSPRMARRISRNANAEGVCNQPKVSPLAQQNNTNHPHTPPSISATSHGMPIQVFPSGPPAPPPPPPQQQQVPPPPPPMQPMTATNGAGVPKPQSFEPPPFGCRPEIKIPANPMAALKKAPRPQPKNDFWVEEYRKENSKSPNPLEQEYEPQQIQQQEFNERRQPSPPQIQQQPQPTPIQSQYNQVYSNETSPIRLQQPAPNNVQRVESPFSTQPNPHLQRPLSPIKIAKAQAQAQIQFEPERSASPSRSPPLSAAANKSPQRVISPPIQPKPQNVPQKHAQVGALYIPPVAPENLAGSKQQLSAQQTPPWMATRANQKEVPEWINEANAAKPVTGQKERVIPIQMEATPTPTRNPSTPGFAPQPFFNANQPQQQQQQQQQYVVSSPQSGFQSPQSDAASPANRFVNQGYNNFPMTPPPALWQPHYRVVQPGTPNSPHSPMPAGSRVIPIQIEGQDNQYRGPISQTPTVIQNDPRSQQNQAWGNGGPNQSKSFRVLQKITDSMGNEIDGDATSELQQPHYARQLDANDSQMRKMQLSEHDRQLMNRVKNQVDQETYLHTEEDPRYRGAAIPSKAFKLLQNMTDSGGGQEQQGPPRGYIRHMQALNQDGEEQPQQYVRPSEQQAVEPKKYMGSAIPSKSFKMLQAMTTPENAGPGQSDL